MSAEIYRYRFASNASLDEVQASLVLAILATEFLHGAAQVRLDAGHYLDPDRRACVIDAGTAVGKDVNRLFVGFLLREFGDDSFTVERVDEFPARRAA
jgi:hypothetical protein